MNLIDELFRVTSALEANNVDYALCGGLAMAVHGQPRATVDIDLLVPAAQIADAVKAAATAGFDLDEGWLVLPPDPIGPQRLYRINKIEGAEHLMLDLLESRDVDQDLLQDRERFDFQGRKLWAISRNSLLRMKSTSGRSKDKMDAEMLTGHEPE